jgi:hypothetical protein
VTIQAVAGAFDYGLLRDVLKHALIMILAALALSFFTLLIESLVGKSAGGRRRGFRVRDSGPSREHGFYEELRSAGASGFSSGKAAAPQREEARTDKPAPPGEESKTPRGLYSPHGNIGWEAYTTDRLESELHRCASNEQDLVFIAMEFKNSEELDINFYNRLAEDAVNFFTLRDLIFERGERGIAVIFPNIDLDMGFAKSEEFHNRILSKYSGLLRSKTDLCIGLSSRSGRLIDAKRLIFEASEALERALSDPVSHIVAFKSDPEKYRAFIASHKKQL